MRLQRIATTTRFSMGLPREGRAGVSDVCVGLATTKLTPRTKRFFYKEGGCSYLFFARAPLCRHRPAQQCSVCVAPAHDTTYSVEPSRWWNGQYCYQRG